MKRFWLVPVAAVAVFIPWMAIAQDAAAVPVADWLGQLLAVIKDFGASGMTWQVKAAAIIMLIVSSMKVSVLNDWFWSKLGKFQIWFAPALGLLAGIVNALSGGSWSDVWAYVAAGGGAVFLHELLDLVKMIPGIGSMWISLINIIEKTPFVGKSSGGK